ncbi:MAG: PAS domain-containing protein [Thermodesulfobacteriota bacterium]
MRNSHGHTVRAAGAPGRQHPPWPAAHDALAFINVQDYRVVAANRAVLIQTGRAMDEVIGQTCFRLTHDTSQPCGPPDHTCPMDITRQRGGYAATEHLHVDCQGNNFYTEVSTSAIRDQQGVISQVVHLSRDTTERIRDEEERRQLVAAVHQATEAIIITDTKGRVQYVNPAFEHLTGYSRGEICGSTLAVVDGQQVGPRLSQRLAAVERGNSWGGRVECKSKGGATLELETTVSPVRDREGQITHAIVGQRDMTREVQLERMLRQAQKMEAIGTLAEMTAVIRRLLDGRATKAAVATPNKG